MTIVKKDEIGLYVNANGYCARSIFGTIFKEGDNVKSIHFISSDLAGVGINGEFNDSDLKTFEYWCSTRTDYIKVLNSEISIEAIKEDLNWSLEFFECEKDIFINHNKKYSLKPKINILLSNISTNE